MKYTLHTAPLLCPGIDGLSGVATYLPPPLLGGLGSPSPHPYGYRYVCIPRCLPRDQHEEIIELVLVRPMEESFLTLGNRDPRSLCPLRPDPVESQVAAVGSIVSRSCGRTRASSPSPSPSCRLTVCRLLVRHGIQRWGQGDLHMKMGAEPFVGSRARNSPKCSLPEIVRFR
jgi:hypothetical protein